MSAPTTTGDRWASGATLLELTRTRRSNLRQYGTVTRYVAAPDPIPAVTPAELRRFQLGEFGALLRLSSELIWHDVRARTLRVHENVARVWGPGLLCRYAKMPLRERVFAIFTEAWRREIASGDAGIAASMLPVDRLATVELFDRDPGGSPEAWRAKLGSQLAAGTTRLVVQEGRHTDALRLSHQMRAARALGKVVNAVAAGIPVGELKHPLDDGP